MTIYRYGWMAWVWRGFIAVGVILSAIFLSASIAAGNFWLFAGSVLMVAPPLFFGMVMAVRADLIDGGTLVIETLLFYRRRIAQAQLGKASVRRKYANDTGDLDSPRAWVPVKGGLPLYFDLLGQMPDRPAFLKVIGLSEAVLRNAD